MLSQRITFTDQRGMQMDTAAALATAMGKYPCGVTIIYDDNTYNGKSLLNIIAAYIKYGSEFELICDGPEEEKAMDEAVKLIQSFGK